MHSAIIDSRRLLLSVTSRPSDADTRLKFISPPTEIRLPSSARCRPSNLFPLHHPSLLPAARRAIAIANAGPWFISASARIIAPLLRHPARLRRLAPPSPASSCPAPPRPATKWRSKMTAAAIARKRRPSRHPSGSRRRRGWPRPVLPPPPSAGTESSAQRVGGPSGRENAAWCVFTEFSFLAATLSFCH